MQFATGPHVSQEMRAFAAREFPDGQQSGQDR